MKERNYEQIKNYITKEMSNNYSYINIIPL